MRYLESFCIFWCYILMILAPIVEFQPLFRTISPPKLWQDARLSLSMGEAATALLQELNLIQPSRPSNDDWSIGTLGATVPPIPICRSLMTLHRGRHHLGKHLSWCLNIGWNPLKSTGNIMTGFWVAVWKPNSMESRTPRVVWFLSPRNLSQGVAVGFLVEAYILNNQAEKVHLEVCVSG